MVVATSLFAERGYDATTTAAIADAAGITEPVLYRHFESKQRLFIDVLRRCTELLVRRWRVATDEANLASGKIRKMAAAVYSDLPELSEAQRVVHKAIATNRDPEVTKVLDEHAEQYMHLATELVELGRRNGEFRTDLDPAAMAWTLINIYTGYAFVRLNLNLPQMDIRVGVEMLLNGMRLRPCPTQN